MDFTDSKRLLTICFRSEETRCFFHKSLTAIVVPAAGVVMVVIVVVVVVVAGVSDGMISTRSS